MSLWEVDGTDLDPIYENYHDSEHPKAVESRQKISEMYEAYEPYADKDFIPAFSKNFIQRYWEISVGIFVLEQGFTLTREYHGKDGAGPDICIVLDSGKKIWIECIAPTVGDGAANKVPETLTDGTIHSPPIRQVELRITSAVYDKNIKIINYRKNGIVGTDDPCIIAISFGHFSTEAALSEIDMPVAVKALFPIGGYVGHFSTKDNKLIKAEHEVSTAIKKISGKNSEETANISRSGFMSEEYSPVAGVITHDGTPSSDEKFILIINPHGEPSISSGLFKNIKEYDFEVSDTTYTMKPKEF